MTLVKLLLLLFLLNLTGCATRFKLETRPNNVEVFAGEKSLGKTPLDFSSGDVPEAFRTGDGVLVRLQEKGYKGLWVWLPTGSRNYDVTLNLNPMYRRAATNDRRESQGDIEFSPADLNRLSDQLLRIQNDLLMGNSLDEKSLNALFEANPTLGTVHFLKALQALRANQTKEGDILLKDAMRFSPEEYDFLSLYNEVNKAVSK